MRCMSEPEEIIIRPMCASDLDAVLAIEQASYPAPWKREHFIQEIHSPLSFPVVAAVENSVAGYLCLMSLFEEAQILNIAVASQQRGRGVASELMHHAIAAAREKGALNLVLEVRESNAAAIALYEKFGFVRYFVRKNYYEGKEDALLMERTLTL